MNLIIILALWTVYLNKLDLLESTSADLPWKNADKLIQAVCPNSNVCELNEGNFGAGKACCEECTCNEENDQIRKCFYSARETETCMLPSTKHPNAPIEANQKEVIDAYIIVTMNPVNGCVDANLPPCNTDNIYTLAPVFSKRTNKTYFNKECAACHGDEWSSAWFRDMICDDFDDSSLLNFDTELQKFLENPATSQCFIQFKPRDFTPATQCIPEKKEEIELLTTNANSANQSEKLLYGMSILDIADACFGKFYSPVFDTDYMKWFPNPFCYIFSALSEKEPLCNKTLAPVTYEYRTRVDNKAIEGLRTPEAKLPKQNEVCLLQNHDGKHVQYQCREVSCPLGHVWGKDSTCTFIGLAFLFQGYFRFSVQIVIKSENTNAIKGRQLVDYDVAAVTKAMHLPKYWKVIFVGHPTDVLGNKQGQADLLLIGFSLSAFEVSLKFMKNHMDKPFQLDDQKNQNYHHVIYPLSLNLSGLKGDGSEKGKIKCPLKQNGAQYSSAKPGEFLSTCWKIFVNDSAKMDSVVVSKLYYCTLVQLMPDEFEILANGSMLYNRVGNNYIHEKEFVVFENKAGIEVVKICVEDSGLVPKSNMTSASIASHGLSHDLKTAFFAFFVGYIVSLTY